MWDIETFCVPPLIFLQPDAAQSILDYRFRNLEAARSNARLMGRRGLQFPWKVPRHRGRRPRLCRVRQPGAKTMLHSISPAHLRSVQRKRRQRVLAREGLACAVRSGRMDQEPGH